MFRLFDPSTALVVVLMLVIAGGPVAVCATPHFVYTRCFDTAGNYTPQSLFQSNLNSLLSDLIVALNSSQPPYSNSYSVGESPDDVVRGLFYCRGDVAQEECRGCVQAAAARIVLDCPSSKQAVVWFEECTLRYSDQVDAVVEDVWASEQAPTANTVAVTADVYGRLFDGLIKEAAYSGSSMMTTGKIAVTPTVSLLGLVQCAPQMSGSQCEECLRTSFAVIPTCCGWQREWVAVFRPSCLVQYRYAYAVPATQDSSASSSSSSSSSSVLVPNAHSVWGYIKYFLILGGAYTAFTLFYYVFIRKIKHVLALIPRWPLPDYPKPQEEVCKVVVECSTHNRNRTQTQQQQQHQHHQHQHQHQQQHQQQQQQQQQPSLPSVSSQHTPSQLGGYPANSLQGSSLWGGGYPAYSFQGSSLWGGGYPANSLQGSSFWGGGSYFPMWG